MTKNQRRKTKLLANDIPRYIRCYDNGGRSADRYTVVFTGRYTHRTGNEFVYLGMSQNPFHPQGVGMHGSSRDHIDQPKYGHLGKRIKFNDLPKDCKECVLLTYCDLWNL